MQANQGNQQVTKREQRTTSILLLSCVHRNPSVQVQTLIEYCSGMAKLVGKAANLI